MIYLIISYAFMSGMWFNEPDAGIGGILLVLFAPVSLPYILHIHLKKCMS